MSRGLVNAKRSIQHAAKDATEPGKPTKPMECLDGKAEKTRRPAGGNASRQHQGLVLHGAAVITAVFLHTFFTRFGDSFAACRGDTNLAGGSARMQLGMGFGHNCRTWYEGSAARRRREASGRRKVAELGLKRRAIAQSPAGEAGN
ncbi:hypothetical protein IWX50DRAFT_620652 [Phyllosticta citricarpa]